MREIHGLGFALLADHRYSLADVKVYDQAARLRGRFRPSVRFWDESGGHEDVPDAIRAILTDGEKDEIRLGRLAQYQAVCLPDARHLPGDVLEKLQA